MKRARLTDDGQVTAPRDHERDAQWLASAIKEALPLMDSGRHVQARAMLGAALDFYLRGEAEFASPFNDRSA